MLHSIRLQNFRSYQDSSFQLDSGVNVVIGKNGSGKTNLLEAILALHKGGSYRVNDKNLISFNKSWARLDGSFDNNHRTVKIEKTNEDSTKKTFIIDDKKLMRLTSKNKLPSVLFEPNHLQLLIRGPEFRRSYIDDLLTNLSSAYSSLLNNYKRALTQRNRLLKMSDETALEQLFVWDVRISELGGKIATRRSALLDMINSQISDIYSKIADKESKVELLYQSKTSIENYSSDLLRQLKSSLHTDIVRGFTTHGPHRDDVVLLLNSDNAAETASRGETRTLLLSLKVFELLKIEEVTGIKPMLLLDDVFSELDTTRQHTLVSYFENHQVIITTTDIKALIQGVKGKIFEL